MEVSSEVFRKSMSHGRMYIGWLKVKEYIDVVRCFKCQGYGHIGKVCNDKKDTCGRCAGAHRTEKCEAENDKLQCVNCAREGRDAAHPTSWWRCGVYRRMEERYLAMVAYED